MARTTMESLLSLLPVSFMLVLLINTCRAQVPLSEKLWLENKPTEDQTYATGFIQGIKNNNLDADIYGEFNLPDILYLNTTIQNIEIALGRSTQQNVTDELLHDLASYKEFLDSMLKDWHLSSTDCITSTPAFDNYANHYHRVATEEDPVYMVVAQIPCSRLWWWMANRIKKEMDPAIKEPVYRSWIDGNASGSGGSSKEALIDSYDGISFVKASEIYHTSMEMELGVFKEASQNIQASDTVKDEL